MSLWCSVENRPLIYIAYFSVRIVIMFCVIRSTNNSKKKEYLCKSDGYHLRLVSLNNLVLIRKVGIKTGMSHSVECDVCRGPGWVSCRVI